MATIAKIKTASGFKYKAIIKKNGKPLKSKTFTRKGDARTWAARIEADREFMDALGCSGAGLTLLELSTKYLIQWDKKDQSNQKQRVTYWTDRLGKSKLVDITPREIREVLKGLNSKAPATINRYKAVLASMLHYAIEQGYILTNPASKVSDKPLNNKVKRYLFDTERVNLLAACKESTWDKLHLLVLMAMTTGMRRGELVNLRWNAIDFDRGVAMLTDTKNGEPRHIPIPSVAMSELKPCRQIGSGLIFASPAIPTKPFEFRKQWANALTAAGISNFRWHDLRHTAASYLIMNGASLHDVGKILGHKSLQTADRYSHLSTAHTSNISEKAMRNVFNS